MDKQVYDEPTDVGAENGSVSLEGPDGVSVLMTPEAAAETSDRLLDGAAVAKGQQANERRKTERPTGR
ncbi:MAG: hypothetical protein JWO81_1425 [Alphaproteobacteria bacterium]|nr:hypothetical protein [Alphaproteobacteria bacterium]